jgi:hypothetical protein
VIATSCEPPKESSPRFSREQLAPPVVVIRNEDPKLPVKPTVVVRPEIHLPLPQTGSLGDPLSSVVSPPSSGTGSGGGVGSGSGGGVGSGRGPGVGPGWGGGIGVKSCRRRSHCPSCYLCSRTGILRRSSQGKIPRHGCAVAGGGIRRNHA